METESGRRKIINHDRDREIHPLVNDLQHQRFGKPRRGLQFLTLRWISLSLYKVIVNSYNPL